MNFDALAAAWAPRLLSILRIMAGLLLLQHGTAKHLKFPSVPSMANLDPDVAAGHRRLSSSWSVACCSSSACSRARRPSSCRA